MHEMREGGTIFVSITERIAIWEARHQSAGSCSAQAAWFDENGVCSAVADVNSSPSSPTSRARELVVPISIPKSGIALLPVRQLWKRFHVSLTYYTKTSWPLQDELENDVEADQVGALPPAQLDSSLAGLRTGHREAFLSRLYRMSEYR